MSLRGFQQALSELVMSPRFRSRVAEGPGEALAAYDLSDQERRRLESLAHDAGMKTGTLIHRSFRLSMLSNTLPRTCKVLGTQGLKELIDAYWRDHLPRNYVYAQEARRFAAFVLERLRAGEVANDYVEEVLETELALLALGEEPPWQLPRDEPPAGPAGWTSRLHPSCRIVPFRHDPDRVLGTLAQGNVPADLPVGEFYLLLVGRDGTVDLKPVSREQGRLLQAYDGGGGRVEPGPAPPEVGELVRTGYLVRLLRP
ncbi:MAG TPA: hypothetical protein VMW27_20910 [Thermoanaerobaculia bacterium]|nr:hypothetical protein [Thermoanaerobaculia bacterium]